MVFSSLPFVFGYLVITLLAYYITPLKWRNLVLFVLSLLFYGWGEPKYIAVMLLSIVSAYGFGFGISKYRDTDERKAKLFLALSLAFNLSFLLFFKYFNFFASIFGCAGIEGLTLPIGISFYTFQIMSYSIDLYRKEVPLAKRFVPFGTYVTLFPQLIAGPIVRYKDVQEQLTGRKESISMFSEGVQRFVCGLGKKLILGDAAAEMANLLQSNARFEPSAASAWLAMLLYTFHIYYDFSGYSDMAIGLGKMFGFRFVENFNYPYIANSITDFWRRWHITLSTWFREYVYIPLGGNRKGKGRTILNLAIVWFLTGFWHGADWNYIIWGVYFLVFLLLEKLLIGKWLEKLHVLPHIYTLLVVGFGWMIFFQNDLSAILETAKQLVGIGVPFANALVGYDALRLLPFILICAVGCTPLPKMLAGKLFDKAPKLGFIKPVAALLLLILCTAYMVDSTFSPFLYFIF